LYARATIMGDALALSSFNSLVTSYMASLNSEGITMIGNTDWGSMRYVASTAFLLALYDKVNQTTFYRKSLYTQIDFLLGGNASRQSFVSGYCENCLNSPQHPHHRNIYLNDNNLPDKGKQSLVIPTILKQFGALVGGNSGRVSYAYTDSILQYSTAEVCIDYNAGLVGALGAIVSEQAPASLPLPLTVLPVSMQQQHGFSVETSGRPSMLSPPIFTICEELPSQAYNPAQGKMWIGMRLVQAFSSLLFTAQTMTKWVNSALPL